VVASDLRLELHKTHYVSAAVKIGETGESGVTFYMQDLSDPEAPLRTAGVRHRVTGGYRSKSAFMIGGRDGQKSQGWDGLIDEVRLSRAALPKEQLLLVEGAPAPEQVAGYWTFESEPGFFKEAGNRVKAAGPARASEDSGRRLGDRADRLLPRPPQFERVSLCRLSRMSASRPRAASSLRRAARASARWR